MAAVIAFISQKGGVGKSTLARALAAVCAQAGLEVVLADLDPRQCEIVEMRFFAGLTVEEIAEVLEISPATVKRDWSTAKMWLKRQMRGL